MLNNLAEIEMCIEEANKSSGSSKVGATGGFQARLVRHIAISTALTSVSKGENLHTTNVIELLSELEGSATFTADNKSENVVALQISDALDKYIQTLPINELTVYIKRYFYGESKSDIASSQNMSPAEVSHILHKCSEGLYQHLTSKGYLVKKETLLVSFTDIGDELITLRSTGNKHTKVTPSQDTYNDTSIGTNNKATKPLRKHLPIVAGILIAAIVSICLIFIPDKSNTTDETSTTSDMNEAFEPIFVRDSSNGDSIIIEKLLSYQTSMQPNSTYIDIEMNYFDLKYVSIQLRLSGMLPYSTGTLIKDISDDNCQYYKLLGHDSLYYILKKEYDHYTLFKLCETNINIDADIINDTYDRPYGYILSELYGVETYQDIASIQVYHYNDPFNDITLSDYTDTETIFNVISQLKFTNETMWENVHNNVHDMDYYTRNSSMLKITTTNGIEIPLTYNYEDNFFCANTDGWITKTIDQTGHSQLNDVITFPKIDENVISYVADSPGTWNLELVVNSVSPTFMNLCYYRPTRNYSVPLYTDGDYTLEKLENDSWISVPVKFETKSETPESDSAHLSVTIPKMASYYTLIWFKDKYGRLEPGQYRVTVYVYNIDTNGEVEYYTGVFSTEFEVEEEILYGS